MASRTYEVSSAINSEIKAARLRRLDERRTHNETQTVLTLIKVPHHPTCHHPPALHPSHR